MANWQAQTQLQGHLKDIECHEEAILAAGGPSQESGPVVSALHNPKAPALSPIPCYPLAKTLLART